ncbi:MAG: translation initiation factor [Candidatus Parcubacteria bacterium]|jgi:translation initiation factor IF-2|nr:translation initiation factor [Candidatus Parcubacteria bacterium]
MPATDQKNLVARPPVVAVMGHIDHGKSTLLDYIRKTNIAAGEAGGITQHIGAYEAEYVSASGKKHVITFIDTPGHEAFCNIRERGARAADVAVLVVSAEDGVKPQTLEAVGTLRENKIPFIVAITKADKPNADVERAKKSLGENQIYIEGWGGDIPSVSVSGTVGTGVPELLELITLLADLANLKTDPAAAGSGLVVESSLDSRQGIAATLIMKDGTLSIGSFVVARKAYAPVRFMLDWKGATIEQATAAKPVRILGWNIVPPCGADFLAVADKKTAEKMAAAFEGKEPAKSSGAARQASPKKTLGSAGEIDPAAEPAPISLPLVLKADVTGSLDGVKHELAKIADDNVRLKIVSEGIGEINENDVKTALGDPEIVIIGFNVGTDKKAAAMIERSSRPLQVKTFKVIYDLAEYARSALVSKIPRVFVEEVIGRARIIALFSKEKDRQVVGGKVETGTIESGNDVRIMRREAEIGRGKIRELQEKKIRVRETAEGHEFGMLVEAKMEIAPGDKVEAVRTVEKTSAVRG